jgi:hypothetical protein
MAIEQNTTIWDIENVTLLEFGKADINVMDAKGESYTCVMFKNQQGAYINAEDTTVKGKTAKEIQPEVIMIFDNPFSIDVVIEKLQLAKSQLLDILDNEKIELPDSLKDPMKIIERGIIKPDGVSGKLK